MLNKLKDYILEHFPASTILNIYEYKDIYVFNIKRRNDKTTSILMNNTFSLNKKTKEISAFFPFNMSEDEYKSGKLIYKRSEKK